MTAFTERDDRGSTRAVPVRPLDRRRTLTLLGAVGVTAAALLSGCARPKPVICPRVAVLGRASSLSRFKDGAPATPENLLFRAQMTDVGADCLYRGATREELESNLRVAMVAERGPAMTSNVAEAEFFVVVTDRSGTVLNKRVFPVRFEFDSQGRSQTVEKTWQYFRLEGGGGGPSFEIWSGFQLTQAELDFNQAQGIE